MSLTLRSDSHSTIEFFDRLYRHFRLDPDAADASRLEYDILTEGPGSDGPVLRAHDGRTFPLPEAPAILRAAETILFHEVVSRVGSHFLIHRLGARHHFKAG